MGAQRHGDMAELLARGAVLDHVTTGELAERVSRRQHPPGHLERFEAADLGRIQVAARP